MIHKFMSFVIFVCCVKQAELLLLSDNLKEDDSQLVAVAVLYRHGDRSPENSFPNDKYFKKSYWPMGFGQLTQIGINRHYKLGQWFRQRYNDFLSDIYSPDEIYVYSTGVDRTLSSALANLAGIYPPRSFQKWNDDIPWQPIPVHTEDQHTDDIIVERRKCPKYVKMLERVKQLVYPPIVEKYSDFLCYISLHTGYPNVKFILVDLIKRIYTNFLIYESHNSSFIPNWTKEMDQKAFSYLTAVGFEINTHTIPITRLRIGPFFHHLFNHFDNFTGSSSGETKPKFLMISAHDGSLWGALDAMGVYNRRPIYFADTIIWELKKRNDGSYFINLLYKKEEELEKLRIHSCDYNCNYDDVKFSMSNITVSIKDWLKECD